MNEKDTEWFRPLWRRIAVTAFCGVWAGWEWLFTGDPLWKWIALAAVGFAVWSLFIVFDRGAPPKDKPPAP